ncbi:MAG: LuxR family transcriptional regulator, partial [Variovorax sp.]|nr:LuxR family transcriptional regulator [Variovorax sp.]
MPPRENPSPTPDEIPRTDALRALAFMGDLSMGQPIDHSTRVARLSERLADALTVEDEVRRDLFPVALLRWSGCTSNAADVADTISDDVAGRAAMLSLQMDKIQLRVPPESVALRFGAIAAIHCEVSAVIAGLVGLPPPVADALRCTFENHDGSGPRGLRGDAIAPAAALVALAGDLEIFTRVYGLQGALALLQKRAGSSYPANHVDIACHHAQEWLTALQRDPAPSLEEADDAAPAVSLTVVA